MGIPSLSNFSHSLALSTMNAKESSLTHKLCERRSNTMQFTRVVFKISTSIKFTRVLSVDAKTVANVYAYASSWELSSDAGCGEAGCDPRLASVSARLTNGTSAVVEYMDLVGQAGRGPRNCAHGTW